jgi:predicted secreted Zn-dependent protease
VLRVIRELPEGTCAHAHVLRHENTHVRIYREMARQFRQLVYPFPDSATSERVLRYAQQQLAKLQEQQRQFDSPEEYAGNLTACKGEIPRLLAAARK